MRWPDINGLTLENRRNKRGYEAGLLGCHPHLSKQKQNPVYTNWWNQTEGCLMLRMPEHAYRVRGQIIIRATCRRAGPTREHDGIELNTRQRRPPSVRSYVARSQLLGSVSRTSNDYVAGLWVAIPENAAGLWVAIPETRRQAKGSHSPRAWQASGLPSPDSTRQEDATSEGKCKLTAEDCPFQLEKHDDTHAIQV